MDRSFIHEFNKFEVRHAKKGCVCKICDGALNDNDMVVYIRSFRLHGQPYHICISCWKKLNKLVEEKIGEMNL